MRSLKDNLHGFVDLGVILMIGIAFVGLIVISYIIFTIRESLNVTAGTTTSNTLENITRGWDSAIQLLLIAITIFILAVAISALLMLRGR